MRVKLSLERKIAAGFALSILVLLLVGGAAIWNVRWLQGTFYWVNHTQDVINHLETALTDVLSMQTSTRGFVLTGSEEMLVPHRAGAERLPLKFQQLRTLLADNPPQIQRLQQAEEQAATAQSIMNGRIAARRARGLDAATEISEFLRGQSAVEAFRTIVEEMKRQERGLLESRFVRTRLAARTTVFTIVSAVVVACVLTGLALIRVQRDFALRREAETERDRFFDASRDMMCIANFDGYFLRLNPAWKATLGFGNAELQARPFIAFIHPDDRAQTIAETAKLVQGGETMLFENRYRCQDGSYRWLSWSARPIMEKRLIIATARDITERRADSDRIRQLNSDLAAHTQQLEEANRELEAFSYSVSHDLRAPLRHIDGFAGLLAKRSAATLDQESQRFLKTISQAAKQMGALVDDLLAFSRIGRTHLRFAPVDHNALVAEVIAEIPVASATPIAWRIAPLPVFPGDQSLLRQVWRNLLDNAAKYSSKAPQPQITIACKEDSERGEHVFSVQDNGVGFDMAYADKLFGVFQRLHGPSEFEGTGIGLANVRRIVSRHGGRTWAEAQVNAGATFYFSLPLPAAQRHPPPDTPA